MDELARLRESIDAVDDDILRLLNRRAALVARVATLKEKIGVPFYVPSRERQIIERLVAASPGPFPSAALRPVFQEIFSACLSMEKVVRVAYLGPEASFTHVAVKQQFGLSARALPLGTIPAVFEEVERGRADFGVVPLESATEGIVSHTLETFLDSRLVISAEIVVATSHALLVRAGGEPGQVERVYAQPQALAACRRWLAANLRGATLVEVASTTEAVHRAREDARGAAIASELAARLDDLSVVVRGIEDAADDVTRFLVIGTEAAPPTGNDRTSLIIAVQDEVGVMHRALRPFSERGVNLTRIESRPARRRPWDYLFFIDVDGHRLDAPIAGALAEVAAAVASLKVLGSYPKAARS